MEMINMKIIETILLICLIYIYQGHSLRASNAFHARKLASSEITYNSQLINIKPISSRNLAMFYSNNRIKSIVSSGSVSVVKAYQSDFNGRKPSALYFKAATENEESDDYTLEETAEAKRSKLVKLLTTGAPPIAATIAYFLTPVQSRSARLAYAAMAALSGYITKNIVDDYFKEIVYENLEDSPKFQTALSDIVNSTNVMSWSRSDIREIAKFNQIPSRNLSALLMYVYSEMLNRTTLNMNDDLTELVDIIDYASKLKLSENQIGLSLLLTTLRIGLQLERDEYGFFRPDYPRVLFAQAAKLMFLSNKLLKNPNGYYWRSLHDYFYMMWPKGQYREYISSSCTRLFTRCVESVFKNPNAFTSEEIRNLREFIDTPSSGLHVYEMNNIIDGYIKSELNATFSKQNIDEIAFDHKKYDKIIEVLGGNKLLYQIGLSKLTTPLVKKISRFVIDDIFANPSFAKRYGDDFFHKQFQRFQVQYDVASKILNDTLTFKHREQIKDIVMICDNPDNLNVGYSFIEDYIAALKAIKNMTVGILSENSTVLAMPDIPLDYDHLRELYKIHIQKQRSHQFSVPTVDNKIFNLPQNETIYATKLETAPKIMSWVMNCIKGGSMNDEAKDVYQRKLLEIEITRDEWIDNALDLYNEYLTGITDGKPVPSESDAIVIEKVQDFLGFEKDNEGHQKRLSSVHITLFGDTYSKALKDCLSTTGVISEEYLPNLERLRKRLCLSVKDAQSILASIVRENMQSMMTELNEIFKSGESNNRKSTTRDKSIGLIGDSNPVKSVESNVFMREAINFIDTFRHNFKLLGLDEFTSESIPVRATGILPDDEAVDLVKYFIINRVTEPDHQLKQRYYNDEFLFASILGLPNESIVKIRESLSLSAKQSAVDRIFQSGAFFEAKDRAAFEALDNDLQLSEEAREGTFKDACANSIVRFYERLVDPEQDLQVPADRLSHLRDQISSFGLDIKKDIGFSPGLMASLFAFEVQGILEAGYDDSYILDAQEGLGISPSEASVIIEAMCKKYLTQLLTLALRAAMNFKENEAIKWLKEIVKYIYHISSPVDCDGNAFLNQHKSRLLGFFESNLDKIVNSKGTNARINLSDPIQREEAVNRLDATINLTTTYVPPDHGFYGLESKSITE